MKKSLVLAAVAALAASCSITPAPSYHKLTEGEYQIPGHPYKTAKNCPRTAPIGKFDRRCDIPVVGFRNFADPSIGVQAGAPGGFGLGGM